MFLVRFYYFSFVCDLGYCGFSVGLVFVDCYKIGYCILLFIWDLLMVVFWFRWVLLIVLSACLDLNYEFVIFPEFSFLWWFVDIDVFVQVGVWGVVIQVFLGFDDLEVF